MGVVTRLMAHKQMEERLEGTEKEVLGLKEMMLELKKVVDKMAATTIDTRMNHVPLMG